MQNFLKLGHNLPVMPVMLALSRLKLWHDDTYMRDYPQGPFGETDSILLRFPVKRVFELEADLENYNAGKSQFDWHESVDYPAYDLLPEVRPLVEAAMTIAKGERLGRVIVNRIKPGGRIFPHEDTPMHTSYYSRFHIPLQSQPGVIFKAGGEQVFMAPGDFWWFDNKAMHEVINNSADDRIHLVIDIRCRHPAWTGATVTHKADGSQS
jgi:hypothetical protein